MSASSYQLNKEELDQVLGTFEIPTCPALVAEVMAEARRESPDLHRLTEAITADVAMSAITLKTANSAMFRSGQPVTNVNRALQRLGTRNVLSIVLGVALRTSMKGLPPAIIDSFWTRNSIMAQSCGMLSRQLFGIDPDAAYVYGLFHDAAIPLMLRRFPEYPALIAEAAKRGESRIQAERQLPCTHPIVGSLLVRNWGLPTHVGTAIRFHHELDIFELDAESLPGDSLSLIAVGNVIEYTMADILPDIDSEVSPEMFARCMEHLGMPVEDKDAVIDLINKVVKDQG